VTERAMIGGGAAAPPPPKYATGPMYIDISENVIYMYKI
jgi:hypothetical protein